MDKFEKWYLPDKDIYVNEYEMQKEAWKAALKSILIDDDAYCCGDVNSNDEFEKCPMTMAIKKELEVVK